MTTIGEAENIDKPENIIKYWAAIEQFNPYKIDESFANLSSLEKEVLGDKNISWLKTKNYQEYIVFFGIIRFKDIIIQIDELLGIKEDDNYDKYKNKYSCLCCFKVDAYGQPIVGSLEIPDYFVSMGCLVLKAKYPNTWLEQKDRIEKRLRDVFDNFCNGLWQEDQKKPIGFSDLSLLLADFIEVSNWHSVESILQNTCYIGAKNSRAITDQDKRMRELIEDNLNYTITQHLLCGSEFVVRDNKLTIKLSSNVEIDQPQSQLVLNLARTAFGNHIDKVFFELDQTKNSSMMNSFFTNDLNHIVKSFTNNGEINLALKQYLSKEVKDKEKLDFINNSELLIKYTSPKFLTPIRWPRKGDYSSFLMQQIAVNIATSTKEGIFSVNGPPGTGKTTLLKDIIANVMLDRAKILACYETPSKAFKEATKLKVSEHNYKVWGLDPKLLGHEILVASSNNNAVENISIELPKQDAIDSKWNIDYFADIATYLMNGNSKSKVNSAIKCWGLGAAVLGNQKNKKNFFDHFWLKVPDEENKDPNFGLMYFLEDIYPKMQPMDWHKARDDFLSTLGEYESLQKELALLQNSITDLPAQTAALSTITMQQEQTTLLLQDCLHNISTLEQQINDLHQNKSDLKELGVLLMSNKPSWLRSIFETLFAAFIKDKVCAKWQEKYEALYQDSEKNNKELRKSAEENILLHKKKQQYTEEQEVILNEINKLEIKIKANEQIINKYKRLMGKSFPDDAFWHLSQEQLHKLLPWHFEQLHNIRGELFARTINLHKAFILNNSEKLVNNLKGIYRVIKSADWPEKHYDLLPTLFASLFLVVPVISSAFASIVTLCKGLGSGAIGWLLIDEAGQATPQAAVGAIWRAKRAIIVGDPMQIEPVITIPPPISTLLMSYYNVSSKWDPLNQSVQTIADRVNRFGGNADDEGWIGCPLRVHIRCNDPMFSVANEIAYGGLMIKGTNPSSSPVEKIYPNSIWIDVKSPKDQTEYWVAEEGDIVIEILAKITDNIKRLPSVYIISPFNNISSNMRSLLRCKQDIWAKNIPYTDNIGQWINNSVGTIHTFQGKEAEVVILLLGSGGISWVTKDAKKLNVALTRAKNLFLVIGDHDLWSKQKFFVNLSRRIEKVLPYSPAPYKQESSKFNEGELIDG